MKNRKRTLFGSRTNRAASLSPVDPPDEAADESMDETDEGIELPQSKNPSDSASALAGEPSGVPARAELPPPDAETERAVEVALERPTERVPSLPAVDEMTDPGPMLDTNGPTLAEHPIGTRIGQWKVAEPLGDGDGIHMLRVHHHRSTRIRATLAVLARERAQDEAARARLVREAETLFPLDHPSIPSVRNLMLGHDPPYLEFEQLRGERLDTMLVRRKTLFMAEALDMVEQLLGILVYLHERQIYHLDIQPRHVMVRPDGVITLLGFGNAVEKESTREVSPYGALPYVAPEWPEHRWPHLADLYGAGALLYEVLTGQRPFGCPLHGNGITVAMVLNAKARLAFLDPGARFREDLRAVVRHLTTREPAGRLAEAGDALSRLQAVERSYAT